MHSVYVLEDETGYVVGASFEEQKAVQIIEERKRQFNCHWTYRLVTFYTFEGTQIQLIAGPIPSEYLNAKT